MKETPRFDVAIHMRVSHRISLPSREHVAVLLKEREARIAAAHDWRFWRWRPKMTLLTLQLGALLAGSIVLLSLHWAPWIPLKTLRGHKGPVTSVSFSSDGKQIVSSSEDRTARVWDLATDKQVSVIRHSGAVLSAEFKNTKELVTTCDDGIGRCFSLPSGNELPVDLIFTPKQVRRSRDGHQLLWFDDDTISWNDRDGVSHLLTLSWTLSLSTASFSMDGKRIVTADTGGDVRVWDAKTERVLAHLSGDKNCFQAAAFSPDGRNIATSGKDGAVRLWEAVNGNEKGSLLQGERKEILPGGLDIWYAQRVALMRGHSLYVLNLQFSPDGSHLATASLDGTVRVWDGKTGDSFATLRGNGTLRTAAFSPDGLRIVAGGTDGVIQVWERRRAEGMAGVVTLSEFWLMVLLAPAFVWSLRRDRKIFAPPKVGTVHHPRDRTDALPE